MHLLFAYGTLAPETSDVASLEGWMADAVRGRLYDLEAYPALVDHDDQDADWVEGYVRPVSLDQLTGTAWTLTRGSARACTGVSR